jgi:hypothetical protein
MLDHGRNFDILQLSEKMAITCHINAVFESNPDLDCGQRRLDLATTMGVDHINPKSWLGDTHIGGVDLVAAWNRGQDAATLLLQSLFGVDKVRMDFNYDSIFSNPDRDILRPDGIYIGLCSTPTKEEQHTPTSGQQDAIDKEELFLDDGLPDDPDDVWDTPQSFMLNGAIVKIDSAISRIHPNSWRQSSDRMYRVQGHHLDKFNTSHLDGLLDAEDAVNDQLMKVYDIIGVLVRVDDDVCFAAMEVKGVLRPEGKKNAFHLSAQYSDLASPVTVRNHMLASLLSISLFVYAFHLFSFSLNLLRLSTCSHDYSDTSVIVTQPDSINSYPG